MFQRVAASAGPVGAIFAIIAIQAAALALMGQPPICVCGYVKFWEGDVTGSGNSQHLTDWYTFTHLLHGLLFYGGLRVLFPRMPNLQRLAIAAGFEAGWEIAENTPAVIQSYRQQALAAGYTGDSIVNSVSDTCAMMTGFCVARRLPVWAAVSAGLGLELWLGYEIRDNLTLNLIGFAHRFDFIHQWQSGL